MSNNNYSDVQLNVMSLIYASQLAVSGQVANLKKLGISPEQALRLSTLNGGDIHDIATHMHRPVVAACFDPEALDEAFDMVDRHRLDQDIDMRLIEAGASYPIMQKLTGMSTRLFLGYRQQLGLVGESNGRPTQPDQCTTNAVWGAWLGTDDMPKPAERLLKVHDITGVSVRDIWQIIQAAAGPGREPARTSRPPRRAERRLAIREGLATQPGHVPAGLAWLYDEDQTAQALEPDLETRPPSRRIERHFAIQNEPGHAPSGIDQLAWLFDDDGEPEDLTVHPAEK